MIEMAITGLFAHIINISIPTNSLRRNKFINRLTQDKTKLCGDVSQTNNESHRLF